MARLFGTDGIRGEVNKYPMRPELVLKLGQAIGIHFKKEYPHPRILIGKDTRRSGYMLEQALSAGICSVGVNVGFLGPVPTPGIAYLTRGMRACAGIVISASHNAFQDNGIKIFGADGYKLPDLLEDKLEAMIHEDLSSADTPTGMGIGTAKRIDDAVGQYSVFLKERFPKHLSLEGVRIVLDCAHGAAYKVAPKVFEELGAELFLLGVNPNGQNINHDSGALHPKALCDAVHRYKADIGLALDGDADRLIVADDKANIVDGDQIMAICGKYMKDHGTLEKNTVVATVMSNMGLDIAMNNIGIDIKRTKVGDRYVVDEMKKGGYSLGGEQSGHLIFRSVATTGDGILAALKLVEIILETGKPVSELRRCMEVFPQVLRNVSVKEKIPLEQLEDLKKHITKCEASLGSKGRILFRYSGTENLARIMIEGENIDQIEKMAADLATTTSTNIAAVGEEVVR